MPKRRLHQPQQIWLVDVIFLPCHVQVSILSHLNSGMMSIKGLSCALLAASLGRAWQIPIVGHDASLDSKPATGNIPYKLPTERTFLLNVPDAYAHGEPHPLVLSFHGGEP